MQEGNLSSLDLLALPERLSICVTGCQRKQAPEWCSMIPGSLRCPTSTVSTCNQTLQAPSPFNWWGKWWSENADIIFFVFFKTEITRLPHPHPAECIQFWNQTQYDLPVMYTMAVSAFNTQLDSDTCWCKRHVLLWTALLHLTFTTLHRVARGFATKQK